MRRLVAAMLAAGLCQGACAAPVPAVVLFDFSYSDTSGETRDQTKEHEARLQAMMTMIRRSLETSAGLKVVTPSCGAGPCAPQGAALSGRLAAAREAGAQILLTGGVHKMSTLVQWAKVEAYDATTGRIVLDKLYSFRGDDDEAWRRAAIFISREIASLASN